MQQSQRLEGQVVEQGHHDVVPEKDAGLLLDRGRLGEDQLGHLLERPEQLVTRG